MNGQDGEFNKRLQAIFKIEAEEHIHAIFAGIVLLEKDLPGEKLKQAIENLFREVHTLKGASRVVSLKDIESLCQPLEGVLSSLKQGAISLSSQIIELLHRAADSLARLVSSAGVEPSEKYFLNDRELRSLLESVSHGLSMNEKPTTQTIGLEPILSMPDAELKFSFVNTIRIPIDKLEPLLVQAEEMVQIKMNLHQRLDELKEMRGAVEAMQDEMVTLEEKKHPILIRLYNHVDSVIAALSRDRRLFERMIDEHLEAMKHVLMLPVTMLLEGYAEFVRDLAKEQGKEAELVVHGAEIEIDKRLLDELKDPLMHILRNSIDHGLEKPDQRTLAGKPAKGRISVSFVPKEGKQIEVLIADDGRGMDVEKISESTIKTGLMTQDQVRELDLQDTIALVFKSGVSTSPVITEISGRGLGLAIVRDKIERLGATIAIETVPGKGTAFRILLPLSLSTFRGVMVNSAGQLFVFPAINVRQVRRVKEEEIKTVENRETILVEGEVISAVRLDKVLRIPIQKKKSETANLSVTGHRPVIILSSEERELAFFVDEVLEEQQFLVKGFGKQLSNIRNISGATVLGNGRIVSVINIQDLVKTALCMVQEDSDKSGIDDMNVKTEKILVADDSITSRTLIKNILLAASYQVGTAVDGLDAFTQVRLGDFDLVVSDVDMPRMNGFELTAGIRAEKRLKNLPVVLVTALESREDRERGIDAGANAYIIKSSFNQSNLLDVIKKLI